MTTTARLACAPPLLLLLLLLAAASFEPAAAWILKPPYNCTLKAPTTSWRFEIDQQTTVATVTLPPGSFPWTASLVKCVYTFDGEAAVLASFASLRAAKPTPLEPLQAACVDKENGFETEECKALLKSAVRTTTAKVTLAARKQGLALAFPPFVLPPPAPLDLQQAKQKAKEEQLSVKVACAQFKLLGRCSEVPDVQVLDTGNACLPGDATVRRVVDGGGATETVRIDELRLGDEVECVAPLGEGAAIGADPASWTDAATDWKPTTCSVYYYLDATAKTSRFVTLHYALDDGAPATFRATREHLAFLAAGAVPARDGGAPAPPRGSAKRMDDVVVGDLLAVRAPDGAFYTAPVTAITLEAGPGAYAPLLTKAGLLVADGAVVFPHAHVRRDVPVHPMTNLGEHYRHSRIRTEYENAVASGCAADGDACPCLDQRRPNGFCARIGMRMRDLPDGVSTFTGHALEMMRAAIAEGRTETPYEIMLRSAPLIRAYQHVTTRLPLLRSLFRPTDGPSGRITHLLCRYGMRAPATEVAAV
jgi:hypothetical protein